jgi:hypothetical protein
LQPPTLETTMQVISNRRETSGAIRNDLGAIFVSMELSRSTWLITSLSPGGGEKEPRPRRNSPPGAMSSFRGGDISIQRSTQDDQQGDQKDPS